jgi:hypothetical protein
MNIRLMGDGDQVAALVAALESLPGLHVTNVSRPYANRRDPEQMRIYLDAEIIAAPPSPGPALPARPHGRPALDRRPAA